MSNDSYINQGAATIMERDYQRLAERLDKIEDAVKEIKAALVGNEYTKQAGLIHTIAEHHHRINSLERVVNNGKWLIIGLSASSGIGVWKLIEMLIKSFT